PRVWREVWPVASSPLRFPRYSPPSPAAHSCSSPSPSPLTARSSPSTDEVPGPGVRVGGRGHAILDFMPVTMDTLVSLSKRRGFIFQSSEIYGGTGSCWDYGPLGVE